MAVDFVYFWIYGIIQTIWVYRYLFQYSQGVNLQISRFISWKNDFLILLILVWCRINPFFITKRCRIGYIACQKMACRQMSPQHLTLKAGVKEVDKQIKPFRTKIVNEMLIILVCFSFSS